MLTFRLISGGRISLMCGQGGGECRGGAADITNFITFCQVNRGLKRRTDERTPTVADKRTPTAIATQFDIFPTILADESKFYPKHFNIY